MRFTIYSALVVLAWFGFLCGLEWFSVAFRGFSPKGLLGFVFWASWPVMLFAFFRIGARTLRDPRSWIQILLFFTIPLWSVALLYLGIVVAVNFRLAIGGGM